MTQSSEERQRQIAHQVYKNRQQLGRPGDPLSDWATAEKIVTNPFRHALFAGHRRLIRLEKQVWEPLLAWANNQAFLSLLGVLGNISLVVAVFTYVGTEQQRRDAEVLNAWQTLTSAHGQAGSGGRIQALEFLNASPGSHWRRRVSCLWLCTWPQEPLDGLNLSANEDQLKEGDAGAYLGKVQLPKASLNEAKLQRADLWRADLSGASFWNANLEKAILSGANLQGATLGGANLQESLLIGANLEGAFLGQANLQGANLREANLAGLLHPSRGQLAQAKLCMTILPDGITLDPNRDCEALGIAPETGEYLHHLR